MFETKLVICNFVIVVRHNQHIVIGSFVEPSSSVKTNCINTENLKFIDLQNPALYHYSRLAIGLSLTTELQI